MSTDNQGNFSNPNTENEIYLFETPVTTHMKPITIIQFEMISDNNLSNRNHLQIAFPRNTIQAASVGFAEILFSSRYLCQLVGNPTSHKLSEKFLFGNFSRDERIWLPVRADCFCVVFN